MRIRPALALVVVTGLALWTWRSELFMVSRPGEKARALALLPDTARRAVTLDVALPAIPIGVRRIQSDGHPVLIHYWAPWEQNSATQAALLDSLRRDPDLEGLAVTIVCFDPFPSVARYVGRHRLALSVLLDGEGHMRRTLPCPSIPYTYVIDAAGRIVIAQPGEVDWWAEGTRAVLREIAREARSPREGTPPRPERVAT